MSDESPFRKALTAARKFGYGDALLRLHDRMRPSDQIRAITPDLVDSAMSDFDIEGAAKGTVLVPMTFGNQIPNCYKSCILAHAYRTRGYRPVIPVCYRDFALCHEKYPHRTDDTVCETCHYRSTEFLNVFGLDGTRITKLVPDSFDPRVDPGADPRSFTYRSVPVGQYAEASLRKFLKKYHLNLDDADEMEMFVDLLRTGVILVEACENLFESENIDLVVGHDVNYIYDGIYLAVAEKHDVPAYSNEWGFAQDTIRFGMQTNRMPTAVFTDESTVREHMSQPLTEEETRWIERFMERRANNENDMISYSSNRDALITESSDRPTVGMFTNLVWDDSLAFDTEGSELPSLFEWIDETVEHFTDRDDKKLVIKTHPAESVHGTNESVSEYLDERYELSSNVRLVPPDTDINTYSLFDDIDVGLVYNSTVGLEMAFYGVPVVVAGETHYRDLGFTHDVDSLAEYRDRLGEISEIECSERARRLAKRYAHLLFIRKHLEFPYFSFSGGYGGEMRPVTHEEITASGSDIETIVGRTTAGSPVIKERER